jgi:methyl-accepting chemotaxis protein WspA
MTTAPKSMKLSVKLFLLVGAFLLAFIAFAAVTGNTISHLKVNGPIYKEIIDGKDIISDILPPPKYIIESYLKVLQINDETDAVRVAKLIEDAHRLRKEYDKRQDFWVGHLAPGKMRDLLVETSFRPAVQFFNLQDDKFIPAINKGDRATAVALARGEMRDRYEEHRAAIDQLVTLTNESNAKLETYAHDEIESRVNWLLALGFVVIGVVVLLTWVTGRLAANLTERIELATQAATQVASGDLTVRIDATSSDETGKLLGAIGTMTTSLHSLVGRVKKASIELISTATQLSASTKQQESTVNGFGASTNEIAAAVQEISATSHELLTTMESVNQVSGQTAQLAESGRSGLEGMDNTMRQLSKATSSISSKLSVIREKAADINVVVTTITKVADQTNLLSVNAAIEAEKAGEYGLGFLVLAREIRRLADQTAVATLDIEQMVKQMQGAVSAGVMEMDKFTEEVRQGVDSVGRISSQLGQIIEQVQQLSDRFDAVNEGMRSQSQGARQISEAMVQLTDGARQTAGSLQEFNSATAHLREAVGGLTQEVAQFKVTT